jgi:aminopeptidase-like protein
MKTNSQIFNFAKKIIDHPRSLSGYGVRDTLKSIKQILPHMKIKNFKSGEQVFDWKIPLEWNVKNAYIVKPNGEKICEYIKNKLHLVGYSIPANKTLSKNKLLKKLHSLPNLKNAIPYVTSYYKKDWGFCIKHKDKLKLKEGNYKIFINSKHKKGVLNYGEILIKGKSKKEILFSTYICHPEMANNETSGISVVTYLAKWIASKKRNFSYRIIFIPETIGSIAYIKKNLKNLKKNLIAGFVVTCVGDKGNFSYIPSRAGNSLSDLVAKTILKKNKKKFNTYTWLDRGSDERQFCAPNIDLPVCSITKTKYGKYKEYHTSLDKLGTVVVEKGLNESFQIYKDCINYLEKSFEKDFFIPINNCFCEPHLSKRNLYPSISTIKTASKVKSMMNILSYVDGKTSIIQIANLCHLSTLEVKKYLIIFKKFNLIK